MFSSILEFLRSELRESWFLSFGFVGYGCLKSELAKPEFLKPGCLHAPCTIYDFLGVEFLESEFSTPEGLRHAVMQSESPSLRTRSDFLKSKLLNIVFRSSEFRKLTV